MKTFREHFLNESVTYAQAKKMISATNTKYGSFSITATQQGQKYYYYINSAEPKYALEKLNEIYKHISNYGRITGIDVKLHDEKQKNYTHGKDLS